MLLFSLKKIAGFWLMPLPLALLLIAAGAAVARFSRRRRLGRGLVAAGLLWIVVCGNEGMGTWFERGLESRFPPIPPITAGAPLPPALARCRFIAVLGGGHSYVPGWSANNELSPSALSRVVEAIRLAKSMPSAKLIVSGPADPEGGPPHSRLLAETAVSLGVTPDRIIEISTARDTEAEAAAIKEIAGDAPVALVTSAWHLPRAMALCRRQKVDALPCPADFAARSPELRPSDFLRWNVGALELSTKAMHEWVGLAWARLRGEA